MTIHREGRVLLGVMLAFIVVFGAMIFMLLPELFVWFLLPSIILFLLVLQFFRHPERPIPHLDDKLVYAPCDGKVVVIEEAIETECLHNRALQVSIFMSPLNVHVNRFPVGGVVEYYKYHAGKYLVAWHPKSSTENERSTVLLRNSFGQAVLVRQIAGAVARRILTYVKPGMQATQGNELGFIKFGSRVDLFLPLDAEVNVGIGQVVQGNLTVIARLP